MASTVRVQFLADAKQLHDAFKKIRKESEEVEGKLDKVGASLTKAGKYGVAGATAAGAALFGFAKQAAEAERFSLRLENTLKNQPQLADVSADAFEDLAAALQKKTAADGDAIVGAQALLGQFGMTKDEILRLTPLVVDLSRKLGVDLDTAAKLVGKSVDGNTGALARYGIQVDSGKAKTDGFGATMDALSASVGGFAEDEGRTLEGRIASLKNQFGDLAEGVGTGVINAFDTVTPAIEKTLSTFQKMDSATQGAVGKFASFGVAGLALAGTLTFVAGKVIQFRDNIRSLATTVDADGTRSLNKFGAAMGVAGVAGAIFAAAKAIDTFANNSKTASEIVGDLSRKVGQDLVRSFENQYKVNTIVGDAAKAYESVAKENLGTAIKLRDAYAAQGKVIPELTAAIERETVAQKNSNQAASTGAKVVDAAIEPQKEFTEELGKTNEVFEEYQKQAKDAEDALRGVIDATLASFSAQLTYEQQTRDVAEAIEEIAVAADKAKKTIDDKTTIVNEAKEAQREYQDSIAKAAEEILGQAAAAARLAKEQTEAQGRTLDAATAADIQRAELEKVAATLKPDSPLRARLQSYIDTLNAIPPTVTTTLQIDELIRKYPTITVDELPRNIPGRAMGGPVSGGSTYVVGERGPELVHMGGSGFVTPNHKLSGGVEFHFHGPVYGVDDFDRKVREATERYARTNGR